MSAVPTLDEVAAALTADPGDPRFVDQYNAAVASQERDCVTEPFTDALREALFRRVAKLWASRAHALGVLDTGTELGVQYVPRFDPVLEDLEGPHRKAPTVLA